VVPKPEWRKRKEEYIAHIPGASHSGLSGRQATQRAFYSARLPRHGEDLWKRFNGGKDGTPWYYRSLVEAFSQADKNELVEELDRVVSEIERLSK
jgi:hypothetical protein